MNAKSERKETYSVVVESGSCSTDYRRWEERANCGHAHKTIDAAERCREKLTRSYCNHGHVSGTPCARCCGYAQSQTTSARWYRATIHNQDGERATEGFPLAPPRCPACGATIPPGVQTPCLCSVCDAKITAEMEAASL
jgi:hypothetical protein